MEQKIILKFINNQLNIGMFDLKNVYLLSPHPFKYLPEVYKGKLFRLKGSTKRISYSLIKKGLIMKDFYITETVPF